MGTDIRGVFQKQVNPNVWINIETEYKFNGHYQLFAFIGNVRNGFTFGGVVTGQVITPLTDNRGLPPYFVEGGLNGYCVSPYDHTVSWFHVNEYLERISNNEKILKTGVISKEDYLKWEQTPVLESGLRAKPNCAIFKHAGGREINAIKDNAIEIKNNPNFTFVKIEYEINLTEEFQYFTDEIKQLIDVHKTDQIRFVFGFSD